MLDLLLLSQLRIINAHEALNRHKGVEQVDFVMLPLATAIACGLSNPHVVLFQVHPVSLAIASGVASNLKLCHIASLQIVWCGWKCVVISMTSLRNYVLHERPGAVHWLLSVHEAP